MAKENKTWVESILHGYQFKNLKKYTKEEFEKFYLKHQERSLDENKSDSKNETRFIRELKRKDPETLIKGQNFGIKYEFHGKEHFYFPDLFIYTPNGYIGFVEIKDVSKINQEFNLSKYKAMKEFCKKHGFLYLYCDSHLNDYELLNSDKYEIKKYASIILDRFMKENNKITINDIGSVINGRTAKYKHWFWLQVAVYTRKHKLKQYGKDYSDLCIH